MYLGLVLGLYRRVCIRRAHVFGCGGGVGVLSVCPGDKQIDVWLILGYFTCKYTDESLETSSSHFSQVTIWHAEMHGYLGYSLPRALHSLVCNLCGGGGIFANWCVWG